MMIVCSNWFGDLSDFSTAAHVECIGIVEGEGVYIVVLVCRNDVYVHVLVQYIVQSTKWLKENFQATLSDLQIVMIG